VQDVSWIPPLRSAQDNDAVQRALIDRSGVCVAMGRHSFASRPSAASCTTTVAAGESNHAVLIVGRDSGGWRSWNVVGSLRRGIYRIVVTGRNLAGSSQSVGGRATLTPK
jgi:hypothetical protein